MTTTALLRKALILTGARHEIKLLDRAIQRAEKVKTP